MNNINYKSCSGGVVLRVIICAASLILAGTVITMFLKAFENKKAEDYRKALAISEYGLLRAFEMIHESPDWSEGFSKEPYEEGSFDVELERQTRDGVVYLRIVSRGTVGSVTLIEERTLRLETSEEGSVWVNVGIR